MGIVASLRLHASRVSRLASPNQPSLVLNHTQRQNDLCSPQHLSQFEMSTDTQAIVPVTRFTEEGNAIGFYHAFDDNKDLEALSTSYSKHLVPLVTKLHEVIQENEKVCAQGAKSESLSVAERAYARDVFKPYAAAGLAKQLFPHVIFDRVLYAIDNNPHRLPPQVFINMPDKIREDTVAHSTYQFYLSWNKTWADHIDSWNAVRPQSSNNPSEVQMIAMAADDDSGKSITQNLLQMHDVVEKNATIGRVESNCCLAALGLRGLAMVLKFIFFLLYLLLILLPLRYLTLESRRRLMG
jgi:hypothetical protein